MNLDNLETIPNSELKLFLKNHNVSNYSKLKRKDLIKKVKVVLKRIQKGGVEEDPVLVPASASASDSDPDPSLDPAQDENATNKSSTRNMFRCCIS
jgi:hypothetical protein